jgi:hypothetical protein
MKPGRTAGVRGCEVETDERAELGPGLGELAAAFQELVEVLLDDGEAKLTPQRIVDFAAGIMPRCEHAGVIVVEDGKSRMLASTDAVPDHVNAIQVDVGDGPALDVLVVDDYLKADDLADDPRWPQFGRRVVAACGIRSMISYRLYLGRRRGAVLNFYSTWPHAFDDVAAAIGAIFAAYCSLTLITQALGDEVDPRRAATVQREIGVATGILIATGKLRPDEALARLHDASRRLRLSVREVARHVTVTGRLPGESGGPHPEDGR